MDGNGSGSCLMADFSVSGVELSDAATRSVSYFVKIGSESG
jgi:hypothetical protein